MSLRTRVLLLGLTAITTVAVLLLDSAREQFAIYQLQSAIARFATEADGLATAIHTLQHERGLSAGSLVPEPQNRRVLETRYRETDTALVPLFVGRPAPTRDFVDAAHRTLPALRHKVLAGGATLPLVLDGYTELIHQGIATLAAGTQTFVNQERRGEFLAHLHLLEAIESLGQIRATLHAVYAGGGMKAADYRLLAGRFALYRDHLRAFLERAPANVGTRYHAMRAGDPDIERVERVVDERLQLPSETANNGDPAHWFESATRAIDALHGFERTFFQQITANIREDAAWAMRRAMAHTVTAMLIGGVIIYLATTSVRRMLAGLNGLLKGVQEIVEKRDFALRLDERAPVEISRISRGFNDLLNVVQRLMSEKDLLATTDPLTGLWNRRKFLGCALAEIERHHRYGRPFSVVLFDIDHFKCLNDAHGHDLGDRVLRTLAGLVSATVRKNDVVARWGGEEFIVLLPEQGREGAMRVAEALRGLIAASIMPDDLRVTCSFGVAGFDGGESFDHLVSRADRALYRAKDNGRNRVCIVAEHDLEERSCCAIAALGRPASNAEEESPRVKAD